MSTQTPELNFRNNLGTGDLDEVTRLQVSFYQANYGFDATFKNYVCDPLTDFATNIHKPGNQIWLAEQSNRIIGCIAIVRFDIDTAQLRWFFVDTSAQGLGLGRQLIESAVKWCYDQRYRKIFLWTIDALPQAAHLYKSMGFAVAEEVRHPMWGIEVNEQRYDLELGAKSEAPLII